MRQHRRLCPVNGAGTYITTTSPSLKVVPVAYLFSTAATSRRSAISSAMFRRMTMNNAAAATTRTATPTASSLSSSSACPAAASFCNNLGFPMTMLAAHMASAARSYQSAHNEQNSSGGSAGSSSSSASSEPPPTTAEVLAAFRALGYKANAMIDIPRTETEQSVKKRFLELAKKQHPDVVKKQGTSNNSNKSMSEINDAYRTLRTFFKSGGFKNFSHDDYNPRSSSSSSSSYRSSPYGKAPRNEEDFWSGFDTTQAQYPHQQQGQSAEEFARAFYESMRRQPGAGAGGASSSSRRGGVSPEDFDDADLAEEFFAGLHHSAQNHGGGGGGGPSYAYEFYRTSPSAGAEEAEPKEDPSRRRHHHQEVYMDPEEMMHMFRGAFGGQYHPQGAMGDGDFFYEYDDADAVCGDFDPHGEFAEYYDFVPPQFYDDGGFVGSRSRAAQRGGGKKHNNNKKFNRGRNAKTSYQSRPHHYEDGAPFYKRTSRFYDEKQTADHDQRKSKKNTNKPKLSDTQLEAINNMHSDGKSFAFIANAMDITETEAVSGYNSSKAKQRWKLRQESFEQRRHHHQKQKHQHPGDDDDQGDHDKKKSNNHPSKNTGNKHHNKPASAHNKRNRHNKHKHVRRDNIDDDFYDDVYFDIDEDIGEVGSNKKATPFRGSPIHHHGGKKR